MAQSPQTRCAALIGPFGSGKSTLARAMQGLGSNPLGQPGNAVETGARRYLRCEYLGDPWYLIDCPGSIEFLQQSIDALSCADVAIVVVEARAGTEVTAMPFIRAVADAGVPTILFVNKIDQLDGSLPGILESYAKLFPTPLLARQLPIIEGETITGSVDLIGNRAFRYRDGETSEVVPIPDGMADEVAEARQTLIESLADFDDVLLERLLEEEDVDVSEVFQTGSASFANAQFTQALAGSAEQANGVVRLFKAARHDAPGIDAAIARNEVSLTDEFSASVIDTRHLQHVGRTNIVRVWKGELDGSQTVGGQRFAGLAFYDGAGVTKQDRAGAGDLVALTRCEELQTGAVVSNEGVHADARARGWKPLDPVYALTIRGQKRSDDAKLSTSLRRVAEEDASISTGDASDGGIAVFGQGEMHLRELANRLEKHFNLPVETGNVGVAWRETITKPANIHARHKKQTGGAGQFADVHVRVKPTSRGSGFAFESKIVGGAVPRQYIPAVEAGMRATLEQGVLGFPVVDVSAELHDGQHHAVDSSEMAFKIAGRMAMMDALKAGDSVLLEPIHQVWFETPSVFSSKLNVIITGRRGRILGFDVLHDSPGWDEVSAMMPEVALSDIILELRAATQGAARFRHQYDHHQELYDREADAVIERRKRELEKD